MGFQITHKWTELPQTVKKNQTKCKATLVYVFRKDPKTWFLYLKCSSYELSNKSDKPYIYIYIYITRGIYVYACHLEFFGFSSTKWNFKSQRM